MVNGSDPSFRVVSWKVLNEARCAVLKRQVVLVIQPLAVERRRYFGGPTSGVNFATFGCGVSVKPLRMGHCGMVEGHAAVVIGI